MMAEFDWTQIERKKNQHRAELAALPPEKKFAVIERLRDEGVAMKRSAVARTVMPEVRVPGSTTVTSWASIHLNVMGANAAAATAAMAKLNSTVANGRTGRTR